MKALLLLRHAKSSWDEPGLREIDRPLTGRGRKAAARMGRLLAERGLIPDLIVCSPARRARETYDALAPALDADPELRFEDGLYLAEPAGLLRLTQALPDTARTVLLIGHNPGLERFAGRLAGSAAGDSLRRMAAKFPTAAL
ncbi:MAG: SixA phosphatase family protein, partial [Geminicoccales bacterium]